MIIERERECMCVCVCVCARTCVCEWGEFRVSMRPVCQCVPRAGSTGSKVFH